MILSCDLPVTVSIILSIYYLYMHMHQFATLSNVSIEAINEEPVNLIPNGVLVHSI